MLETHIKLCVTELDFQEKSGKMGQKWAKTGFFEYIEKFCH